MNNLVIKAVVNPMKTRRRPLHIFIYEEDDINLAGFGVPGVIHVPAVTVNDGDAPVSATGIMFPRRIVL
jgi:hypothetical protein